MWAGSFDDFLRDFPLAVHFIDQNRDHGVLVSCMTGATRVTPALAPGRPPWPQGGSGGAAHLCLFPAR